MMKKAALILILGLVASVGAMGQPAASQKPDDKAATPKTTEQLPSVDQLLDKYVKALGGKAAIERMTSASMTGTFDLPAFNASGTVERVAKAPDKFAIIIDVTGYGLVRRGYDGKTAWSDEPQAGLRDLAGVELAQTKREALLHREIMLKELYPKMVVKGKEKVGDHDTYVIEATPNDGGPEKMYFDAQSGLLIRQDLEAESPQGKQPVEAYSEDYKEVDGVKMPFTLRQNTPQFSITIKLTEIKTNVPVDEAKFNKPSAK
jgi:hypothetical protein